jgi:hypothetical protein
VISVVIDFGTPCGLADGLGLNSCHGNKNVINAIFVSEDNGSQSSAQDTGT